MSNQPENEMQQTPTPEDVRQYLLAELEASQQVIEELSDEELEKIAGAGVGAALSGMVATYKYARTDYGNGNPTGIGKSFQYAIKNGASTGNALYALGEKDSSSMLTHMHKYGGAYRNAGAR